MQISGPRLLIRPLEAPRPKSSILFIPETVEAEPSNYGLVLAVGNGARNATGVRTPISDIVTGDTVIVKRYASTPITVNDEPAMIVMQDDVLAVVTFDA